MRIRLVKRFNGRTKFLIHFFLGRKEFRTNRPFWSDPEKILAVPDQDVRPFVLIIDASLKERVSGIITPRLAARRGWRRTRISTANGRRAPGSTR